METDRDQCYTDFKERYFQAHALKPICFLIVFSFATVVGEMFYQCNYITMLTLQENWIYFREFFMYKKNFANLLAACEIILMETVGAVPLVSLRY